MAPAGACGAAQSTARSNAEFEADRFREGFHKKLEGVPESNDACSSRGSERKRWGGVRECCRTRKCVLDW